MDSPRWLKNKEATISPKINYNKSFQYTITVTLNHENIQKEPQRITKNIPFIYQYNWKDIIFNHAIGKVGNK